MGRADSGEVLPHGRELGGYWQDGREGIGIGSGRVLGGYWYWVWLLLHFRLLWVPIGVLPRIPPPPLPPVILVVGTPLGGLLQICMVGLVWSCHQGGMRLDASWQPRPSKNWLAWLTAHNACKTVLRVFKFCFARLPGFSKTREIDNQGFWRHRATPTATATTTATATATAMATATESLPMIAAFARLKRKMPKRVMQNGLVF